MKYELFFTESALLDLEHLDKSLRRRIIDKLEYFISIDKPMKCAKPLKGEFAGLFRFRIGNYRVIFSKDKEGEIVILNVLRVKHRKDVYE